jgi:phage terminase Nu1 subunit (DNA packaging protein)
MATQREIAEHIDLSTRRVKELFKCGVLPSGKGRGGLDVNACRHAYIRYLRGLRTKQIKESDSSDVDVDLERALNLAADTRLKELKEEQLRKELAPVRFLELVLSKTCIQISEAIGRIPERIKMKVPRLSKTELEIIGREVDKCLKVADGARLDIDEFGRDGGLQDRSISSL